MFELGITTEQVIGYLLVFARVGAWVWLTPPFGGPFLPPQVRVLTGLAFAIPMTPGAIAASGGISLDPLNLLFQFAIQIAIGVALGLVCLILLSAVQSAGAVIDVTGGFALAQAYDPLMQQQASVISRVYRVLAGVLILVSGGYLIILAGFCWRTSTRTLFMPRGGRWLNSWTFIFGNAKVVTIVFAVLFPILIGIVKVIINRIIVTVFVIIVHNVLPRFRRIYSY